MIAFATRAGGWSGGGPAPLTIQITFPMIPAGQPAREMVGLGC
jgi:hypothetical protein